jgi:hypothetical protein
MSGRLPQLFPYGLVAALCCVNVMDRNQLAPMARRILVGISILALGGVVVLGCRIGLQHRYLALTHDYDRHSHEYLYLLGADGWRGNVVLSDPFTSYFARGILGCYAVTVPPGHASPAINYREKDRLAKRFLSGGPVELEGFHVDKVLINKRVTPVFAGASVDSMLAAWTNQGWRITVSSADAIVLTR